MAPQQVTGTNVRRGSRPAVVPVIPLPLMPRRAQPSAGKHKADGSAPIEQHKGASQKAAPLSPINGDQPPTPSNSSVPTNTEQRSSSQDSAFTEESAVDGQSASGFGHVAHGALTTPITDAARVSPPASQPGAFSMNDIPPLHGQMQFQPSAPPAVSYQQPRMPMHQPHPSDANHPLGFYPAIDSHDPSPAPIAGAMFPPPPAGFMPYPGYVPNAQGWMPGAMFGGAPNGIPTHPYNTRDSRPPSFHGSQASLASEDKTLGPILNGVNGNGAPQVASPPPFAPMMGMPTLPLSAITVLAALRDAYVCPEFADCILLFEIDNHGSAQQSGSDGLVPVQVPGHRMILAQSPLLRNSFVSQAPAQNLPAGQLPKFVIRLGGPYITADGLNRVLRTLYGWPLEEHARVLHGSWHPKMALMNALADLTVGLGLHMPHSFMMTTGEHASQCVHWESIELALEFCLCGARDLNQPGHTTPPPVPCPAALFPYSLGYNGEPIRSILHAITNFIVKVFPERFRLDHSVAEPNYCRIPSLPRRGSNAGSAAGQASNQPSSSHHSRQSSRISYDPRLSQIRFGDLSPPKEGQDVPDDAGSTQDTASQSFSPESILSRLLLNLPFDYLKLILEHPRLGCEAAWVSISGRRQAMIDVVREREVRRLAAVEAVKGCRVPSWDIVMRRLTTSDGPDQSVGEDAWDALGWKELVTMTSTNEPRLIRTWVGLLPQQEK